MDLSIFLILLVNVVLSQGRTEVDDLGAGLYPVSEHPPGTHFDVYASALSKAHYNPWACDYRSEPGYKCLSCNKALHCYPGNFALLVQCAGIFSFCRNGYCSRFKNEGCIEEPDGNAVSHGTLPPYVQVFNRGNKTTTVAPATSTSHDIVNLQDSVQQESDANTVATQIKDPNKIGAAITTSSKPTQVNNKPNYNDKPQPRISDEINS